MLFKNLLIRTFFKPIEKVNVQCQYLTDSDLLAETDCVRKAALSFKNSVENTKLNYLKSLEKTNEAVDPESSPSQQLN